MLNHPAADCSRDGIYSQRANPLNQFGAELGSEHLRARLIWFFVALGIAARLIRYALCFPLGGDENLLAASLGTRSLVELLQPLDYSQVAPPGFLLLEKLLIDLCGFNEYALRLLPLLCGILSVLAFKRLATRVLSGSACVLAVAIFSVSYYPIRLAAEVKPYAGDLLVATVLIELSLCLFRPDRRAWPFWALLAATPIAILISFPAVFVAGGLVIGALALNLRARNWSRVADVLLFAAILCASFGAVYLFSVQAQYQAHARGMNSHWAKDFPPLRDPVKFLGWFVQVHVGDLFAYPVGGRGGASAVTTVFFCIGLVSLARNRYQGEVIAFVSMFGLAFIAACMGKYVYGAHPRFGQFLGPCICLAAAQGVWCMLVQLQREHAQRRLGAAFLTGMFVIGAISIGRDMFLLHPDKGDFRDFARTFWSRHSDGKTQCVLLDQGVKLFRRSHDAPYIVAQKMYRHPDGITQPQFGQATDSGELCCILYHSGNSMADEAATKRWWNDMQQRYDIVNREVLHGHCYSDEFADEFEVVQFRRRDTIRHGVGTDSLLPQPERNDNRDPNQAMTPRTYR